jgi:hypothetical protein
VEFANLYNIKYDRISLWTKILYTVVLLC